MDAEIRTSLGDFTAEVTANGIGVDLPRYDRRVFLCSDQPSPPDYWARALNTTLSPPILTHSWLINASIEPQNVKSMIEYESMM